MGADCWAPRGGGGGGARGLLGVCVPMLLRSLMAALLPSEAVAPERHVMYLRRAGGVAWRGVARRAAWRGGRRRRGWAGGGGGWSGLAGNAPGQAARHSGLVRVAGRRRAPPWRATAPWRGACRAPPHHTHLLCLTTPPHTRAVVVPLPAPACGCEPPAAGGKGRVEWQGVWGQGVRAGGRGRVG